MDRNTLDALQRSQDHTNELLKSAREDTESMLRRLGANMQHALEKVQSNGLQNEEYNRRLFEQKLADFQDEMSIRNQ